MNDVVLFLSKEELAFRGHDKSTNVINRGNYKELFPLLIARSPAEKKNSVKRTKKAFSGDSKTVQNEIFIVFLITLMIASFSK